MNKVLENLKYTQSHEWAKLEGDIATVGITDHAQHALGDIVFVELPEIGKKVIAKKECGVVESVKSASDVYAPLSGEITEINQDVVKTPSLLNQDPYEKGWLYKLKISDKKEYDALLDSSAYSKIAD